MKTVLVLTGLGLSLLAVLACRSSTPPPVPAAHVHMPEQPPTVEIVQEIESDAYRGRVLTPEEALLLKREGTLDETVKPERVVVYDIMTRSGPRKHLKVKQEKLTPAAAAPKTLEEMLGAPVLKEHYLYSRAGPFKNRPVKQEVPVAKQD